MRLGNFLYRYLGALISPKRLAVSYFQNLINKASLTTKGWNPSCISRVSSVLLLKSVILTTPSYVLFYVVPDTILDKITKITREFLWTKGSNRSVIHSIVWANTTLDMTEEGLRP